MNFVFYLFLYIALNLQSVAMEYLEANIFEETLELSKSIHQQTHITIQADSVDKIFDIQHPEAIDLSSSIGTEFDSDFKIPSLLHEVEEGSIDVSSSMRGLSFYPHSCIWVRTLNYQLETQSINNRLSNLLDDSDTWHFGKRKFLYKSYKFIRQPNVAVGRIGLVYSKPDNAQLFVNYYDLPNLYVSGWSVKNLPPKQSSALKTYAKQEGYEDIACIQEASRLLKKDADVTYVNHLTKIFKSLFRPQISLEDIHRDLHHRFTQTYQLLEQLSSIHYLRSSAGNALFSSRFYDTEQAIFYDIIKQINTLIVRNALFENVPAYSTIHLFSLDIASYLDMCFDCGDTAFCQTKGVSGFAKEVRSMFYGLNGSYEYAQSFEVFIKVSSQHRCVDTDWDSRGDQTNYDEVYNTHHLEAVAPLESRAFGSYIAQLKVDK